MAGEDRIGSAAMETALSLLKYGFVLALAIEGLLIGRALIALAVEKARGAATPPQAELSAAAEGE
jgi:hypothetical protein